MAKDGKDEDEWEEVKNAPDEVRWKLTNNVASTEGKSVNEGVRVDGEDQNEDILETLWTKRNQRKLGLVLSPDNIKFDLSNSGFEDDDESDGDRKNSLSSTSVVKQKSL